MNIQCSRCGHQNPSDLKFCTNCGNQLSSPEPATILSSQPPTTVPNQPFPTARPGTTATPKRSKTNRNLAIFGGLGCLVLIGSIAGLFGLLYYIGSQNENRNVVVTNGNSATNVSNSNRGTANSSTANTSANKNSNANSSPSNTNTSQSPEEEMRNFLPATVGDFERQGEVVDGDVTEDYPGADKIVKTKYSKRNKTVDVVLAQFSSPAAAKSSYGYFLQGFKDSGAKVRATQKIRNKTGVETGEIAFYTYKGINETMFYADKYGFRIFSTDQKTLLEFIQDFGKYVDMFEE